MEKAPSTVTTKVKKQHTQKPQIDRSNKKCAKTYVRKTWKYSSKT